MVLPNLLHPILTDIQSVSPSQSIQDDGYNEPVQTIVYGSTVTVPGQWKWFSDRELRQQRYGSEEGSVGYVLFRMSDLAALSFTLKRGDHIIAYGAGAARVEVDVYVVKIRYEGHYTDQGGPTLVKAFFIDQQPARQSRGS